MSSKLHKLLTKHSADWSSHQHVLWAIVHSNVDYAIADGLADLGSKQHRAQCLKDSSKNTGLLKGNYTWSYCRTKRVSTSLAPTEKARTNAMIKPTTKSHR